MRETIDATLNRVSSSGVQGASYFAGSVNSTLTLTLTLNPNPHPHPHPYPYPYPNPYPYPYPNPNPNPKQVHEQAGGADAPGRVCASTMAALKPHCSVLNFARGGAAGASAVDGAALRVRCDAARS